MAYATVQDLIDAYGEDEMVRVTTPDGAEMGGVNVGRAEARLEEASDTMDSYLRKRYQVPVPVTPVILRCCCDIARYLLRLTGSSEPSDQVSGGHKRQIVWLEGIAAGRVTLDGAVPPGPLSGARVSDRPAMFGAGGFRGGL